MRKHWITVFGLGLMLLWGGCHSLPKAVFTPEGISLRIVTYNVNMRGYAPGAADFLYEVDADIVCLQETHDQWESYLREHLSERYPYRIFHNARGAGGISILSKHPLRARQVIPSEAGWFPALYAVAETPMGDIGVLNVHLKPPLSDSGSVSAYALIDTPQIHEKEIMEFFEALAPDIPVIVAGDLNEDDAGKACQWLQKQGYTDSLPLFDRKSPTWIWRTKPGFVLKGRYDHIFVHRRLQCTGAGVFTVKASDHEPVLSVVQPGQ